MHPEIIAQGSVVFLKKKLIHYKYNGINEHISKLWRYATHQAVEYNSKTGKITAFHVILKPTYSFLKHLFIQLGFLDGFVGLVIAYLRGYTVLMRYVKFWLLKRSIK